MTKVVPTKEKLASLPKLQQQVYDLVLRTTLAMFADPYEYEETTIITQVGDANFATCFAAKTLFAKNQNNGALANVWQSNICCFMAITNDLSLSTIRTNIKLVGKSSINSKRIALSITNMQMSYIFIFNLK
ncbi:hypothetical protein FC17_GL000689 [Secundilactobacillus paracollinoides DSM 15502 = JCM 11969]|nr:hypothetical protein FC17_GL000689 [Secundilactobacillus paracollinoides DSM 15502 = JCM 11969]